MNNFILLSLILTVFASGSFAQTPAAPAGVKAAIEHQDLARAFVAKKNWQKAREEAKLATAAAPASELNRDSWLILATTEERLENFSEATDAYAKYLSLSPAPKKKAIVQDRLTELEIKVDRYKRYKWGRWSMAAVLGTSPTFNSKTTDQIDSSMSSAMDLGFRINGLTFGFKKGVGKAGAFTAPTNTTANPPYGNVAAGSRHVIEELYFQYDFDLTNQAERSQMVWTIPLYMAGVANSVRTETSPKKLYVSYGYDIATGLNLGFYTKSAISFDLGVLYHLGIPFTAMQSSDDLAPIKTTSGEDVGGATTGAEVRVGIKILFGATPPNEDP